MGKNGGSGEGTNLKWDLRGVESEPLIGKGVMEGCNRWNFMDQGVGFCEGDVDG